MPYPHPYILIWMETLRHADPMSGTPSYPEPTKGYLEQDADLMMACEVCETFREEQKELEEKRKQVADLVKQQGW